MRKQRYGDKARHGQSKTPEHRTWNGMIQRCTDPNSKSWHRYGGRGIKVCERWMRAFGNFLLDMGMRPPNTSLDRINNDGNYEPDNCRWATNAVQNRNRSDNVIIEFAGESLTLTDWATRLGITKQALRFRLHSDEWTLHDALTVAERRHVRGERHKLAKITDAQAAEVIRRRRAGEKLRPLATEFGISEARISKLARRAA